jgi:serine/threonine kinase 16
MCLHEGKPYIIKRIPLHEPEDLIRAADQFNNLRNYDHPHVLFAYKAGIGNAPTWTNWTRTEVRLVLPFTSGHLLSVELAEREFNQLYIHPRRIVRLLREMLDGLFEIHSHSNGDAHRDIRPGTIMIRVPDDWPVILDLDCCTPAVVMTNDEEEVRNIINISENITSLFYRAPETFDIRPESVIDERTDIWAMGCLLFAMCFFRSPFQPAGTGTSISVHLNFILAVIDNQNGSVQQIYQSDQRMLIIVLRQMSAIRWKLPMIVRSFCQQRRLS